MSPEYIQSKVLRPESQEHYEAAHERDTAGFLKEKHIKPLDILAWMPRQPLVFVMPDRTRSGLMFKHLQKKDVPNLAYLHAPTHIGSNGEDGFYSILNGDGAQIDYYAFDKETSSLRLIRSSNSVKEYKAEEGYLYQAESFPI